MPPESLECQTKGSGLIGETGVSFLNGLLLRDLLALHMVSQDPQCAYQAPFATSISLE